MRPLNGYWVHGIKITAKQPTDELHIRDRVYKLNFHMTDECVQQLKWASPSSAIGKEAKALLQYTRTTWSAQQIAASQGRALTTADMLDMLLPETQGGIQAALAQAEHTLRQLLHLAVDLRMLPAIVKDADSLFAFTVRTRVLSSRLLDRLPRADIVRHAEFMWQFLAWGNVRMDGPMDPDDPSVQFASAQDLETADQLRALIPDVQRAVMALIDEGLHVMLLRIVGEVPARRRVTDWIPDAQLRRLLDPDGVTPSGGWALARMLLTMFEDGDSLEAQITLTTVSASAGELQSMLEEDGGHAPTNVKGLTKQALLGRAQELLDANMDDLYHLVRVVHVPTQGVWLDLAYEIVDRLESRKLVVCSRARSTLQTLQAHVATAVRARTWVRNMLTLAHAHSDGVLAEDLVRVCGNSPILAARVIRRAARHFCNTFLIGQSMMRSRELVRELDALDGMAIEDVLSTGDKTCTFIRVGVDGRRYVTLQPWVAHVVESVAQHKHKTIRRQVALHASKTDLDVLGALTRAGTVRPDAAHVMSKDTLPLTTKQAAILKTYVHIIEAESTMLMKQQLQARLSRRAVPVETVLAAYATTHMDRIARVLAKATPQTARLAWPMFALVLSTARHIRQDVLQAETDARARIGGVPCTICDAHTAAVCSTSTCAHIICVPCAVQMIETRIRDAAAGGADLGFRDFWACFDPTCTGTYRENGSLNDFLTNDLLAMEAAVTQSRKPIRRSPCAGCGDVYECVENDDDSCVICSQRTCGACGHVAHPGIVCPSVWTPNMKPDTILSLVKAQKCPGCQTLTTKDGMCNHITCSSCPTHWCWACATAISPKDPLEHYMAGSCAGLLHQYSPETERRRMQTRLEALASAGTVTPELAKVCIDHLHTEFAQTHEDL